MAIIFRKLNQIEEEQLDKELSYWISEDNKQRLYLENRFMVGEGNWRELFIVNPTTYELVINDEMISPYSVGLGFGEYKKSGLLLSLGGAGILCNQTEIKAVLVDEAEQLFLFKRDIISTSISQITKKVNIGDKVIVVNTKNEFLGVGKLEQILDDIINHKDTRSIALRNIIDLGWFLRKGK